MEKIAREIEKILEEKQACYEELKNVLTQEKGHIAAMDVDALWSTTRTKKELGRKIEALRQDILTLAGKIDPDGEVPDFSLADVIKALSVGSKMRSRLLSAKARLDVSKKAVAQSAQANRTHVSRYLTVVDEVMGIIVNHSKQDQYTRKGVIPENRERNRLFQAEV